MKPTVKLVDENTADPRVRAVFDDIKATKRIDRVPNFWRALAANPDNLERAWKDAKDIMKAGKLDLETARAALATAISPSS